MYNAKKNADDIQTKQLYILNKLYRQVAVFVTIFTCWFIVLGGAVVCFLLIQHKCDTAFVQFCICLVMYMCTNYGALSIMSFCTYRRWRDIRDKCTCDNTYCGSYREHLYHVVNAVVQASTHLRRHYIKGKGNTAKRDDGNVGTFAHAHMICGGDRKRSLEISLAKILETNTGLSCEHGHRILQKLYRHKNEVCIMGILLTLHVLPFLAICVWIMVGVGSAIEPKCFASYVFCWNILAICVLHFFLNICPYILFMLGNTKKLQSTV